MVERGTLGTAELSLIRTSDRDHIPKQFSFPVGAEIVSRALENVPGYENSCLSFTNIRQESTPARLRERIRNDEPIEVLTCSGCAYIYIYPVFREHKAMVRQLLVTEGFPRLERWLFDFISWAERIPDRFLSRSCKLSVRVSDASLHFSEKEYLLPEFTKRRRPRTTR